MDVDRNLCSYETLLRKEDRGKQSPEPTEKMLRF